MNKQMYLFNLNDYKNIEKAYEVRLLKKSHQKPKENDGETLASFKHIDHCLVMQHLQLEDDQVFAVFEITKGKVTNIIETWEVLTWNQN